MLLEPVLSPHFPIARLAQRSPRHTACYGSHVLVTLLHWPASPVDSLQGVLFSALLSSHLPLPSHLSPGSQIGSVPPPHAVPLDTNSSFGQASSPLQYSATSHLPGRAARHCFLSVDLILRSGGQVTSLPLHVSSASQGPAAARQTSPLGRLTSVLGQLTDEPSQNSGRSHGPAEGRQAVVLGA